MASKSNNGTKPTEHTSQGINRIVVSGYKSISNETSIEVRPLTILAGANSSGKSSIMQPLLLLKQTLEASFDPGPLLLNGPHIKFTLGEQLLSRNTKEFLFGIQVNDEPMVNVSYVKDKGQGFRVKDLSVISNGKHANFSPEMSHSELIEQLANLPEASSLLTFLRILPASHGGLSMQRVRSFIEFFYTEGEDSNESSAQIPFSPLPLGEISEEIQSVIHVPGLRGNPEREYPITAVTGFSGTFSIYTASVIAHWQTGGNKDKLNQLDHQLMQLGLTSTVFAERINDAQIRLQVGRLLTNGKRKDLVNIADVGFGVSQALPVLVALLTADPGQLVYIEQPEIHLHPRAQSKMAEVLAAAARRGVKVVVETHSSILLLGIQTLVAKGELDPNDVILHWFTRNPKSGDSKVSTATLDEAGRFGNWPEDFADTTLEAQAEYLDAAELQQSVS
ncbi:MAG: DUF3696 domain-containing protein [Chloroflexia bacterium]